MRSGSFGDFMFTPLGEQAVIVTFGDVFDPSVHGRIVRLAKRLEASPFPGFQENVPAYTTVTVYFDVITVMDRLAGSGSQISPFEAVCAWIAERIEELQESSGTSDGASAAGMTAKEVRIPVCYCPVCGPDLQALAERNGLSVSEVIQLHSSSLYSVTVIGFMPGFPYLTGLPDALNAPRLESPRTSVPKGSVAIGGKNTGIYPLSSPGGWRLIGRTSTQLFRLEERSPSLLEVGDNVRFDEVEHEEFEEGLRHGMART